MPKLPVISRVVLDNYKSIRHCDVRLEPVTFLVGPNGSGKSNFLESLQFLSDGLNNSLEQAVESRAGFMHLARKVGDPVRDLIKRGVPQFSFEVHFQLSEETKGKYAFELESIWPQPVVVTQEECVIYSKGNTDWYKVNRGKVESNQQTMPAASAIRLYLVNASGLTPFEPVYRVLSGIAVYNPVPGAMRGFVPEKRYRYLDRTGSGLAETVAQLQKTNPERLARILEYLRRISSGVSQVSAVYFPSSYELWFELKRFDNAHDPDSFSAYGISDGTLRALAILVALFHENEHYPLSLIGLEEPEAGLHPAAAGLLFDALMEASHSRQVVVTSHSPDLLDREDIPENSLKAVAMDQGETVIGNVDEVGRTAMRDRLYTAGELLRMDQLRPEGISNLADAG